MSGTYVRIGCKAKKTGTSIVQGEAQSVTCSFTARENISAYRVVYADGTGGAFLADKDNTMNDPIGVALHAAVLDNNLEVLMFGKITDPTFSMFTVGDTLYLGDDGLITNVPATTGYHVRLGSYAGNNMVFIDIDERICLP